MKNEVYMLSLIFLIMIEEIINCNNFETWIKYNINKISGETYHSEKRDYVLNKWYVDIHSNFPDKYTIKNIEESLFFEIPTKNSFFLIFSGIKIKIYDRKNPDLRKLVEEIEIPSIIHNSNFDEKEKNK